MQAGSTTGQAGGMPLRKDPSPEVTALLRLQDHVISREQALGNGMSLETLRRLLKNGTWRKLDGGVYTNAPDDTWRRRAWCGLLVAGDRAVIGHDAAAFLHGLRPEPAEISIWVGREAWPSRRPGYEFVRGLRSGVGTLSRTRVEDTVLDLAARLNPDALCALVADAVHKRRTTERRLAAALRRRPWQRQRALLRDLVEQVETGVRSPLERRYLLSVERPHGLPEGRRQSVDHAGRHCDVTYDWGLIVELDGERHHGGSRAFDDMDRDNDHVLAGHPTLRLGWMQVTGAACESARKVSRALTALGWPGPPRRCPRCVTIPH